MSTTVLNIKALGIKPGPQIIVYQTLIWKISFLDHRLKISTLTEAPKQKQKEKQKQKIEAAQNM